MNPAHEPAAITIPEYFRHSRKETTLEADGIVYAEYKTRAPGEQIHVRLTTNILIVPICGAKIIHADNEDHRIEVGEILFLKKNTYVMSEIMSAEIGVYESLLIFFDDEFLSDFALRHADKLETALSGLPERHAEVYKTRVTPFIKANVESLLPHFVFSNREAAGILSLKLSELMLNLLDADDDNSFKYFLRDWKKTDHVSLTRLMENNFDKQVTVGDLARMSGRSVSTFKREFAEIFGCSPGRWITERRLEKARFQLVHEDVTVTDAALDAGFDSVSHFIQAFRKKYGATPKQLQIETKTTKIGR